MNPTAKQIAEAVLYIQNHETGGRPELLALIERIERQLRHSYVVKLHMLPEIAQLLEEEFGTISFHRVEDMDKVLLRVGPVYSKSELLEITMLEHRWNTDDPPRVAAVFDKHGGDLCRHAAFLDIELNELEIFGNHFHVTEDILNRLHKLPLKKPVIAALLEDGVPVEELIALTNELRKDGLRGLADRVRAASQGYPKPLLGGVI